MRTSASGRGPQSVQLDGGQSRKGHFCFDQDAGADLGRDVATYVYEHNLRRAKHSDNDDEGDNDDEHDRRSRRRD